MNNLALKVFDNEQFGSVRSITKDGQPWFVGVNVARALGYNNPRKELVVEGGIEYISEDGLWRNLYRQSKQYYKDLEVKRIIDTTTPLF